MKQRKRSLTTDVKTRKRKYTRSSSNYYMYIWSNKSLFPVNGWPSRSNELMFRANGWSSRSNELVFRVNGWPSRSNELVFRANGWTSCSKELVFRVNGWPSRSNGLVFRANGWPSRSNGCKVFSNGLQTIVNGILLKNGKSLKYVFPCTVTIIYKLKTKRRHMLIHNNATAMTTCSSLRILTMFGKFTKE